MLSLGEFLSTADHRTILSAAFGEVPRGMRGALRRIGPAAKDQRTYTLLHQLLAQPPHGRLAECIRRMHSISRTKLLIARLLPPELCRPNVVEAISDVEGANDVALAYNLLISRGVDRDALAQAICRVRSERDLMNLWHRWLRKADCPKHPVSNSEAYSGISSAEDLHRLSLHQYHNCASQRFLLPLVEGTDAFAEFEHENKRAMVHLRHLEGRWCFEGFYGPQNARPSSSLREALTEHLRAHDVAVPSKRRKESEWEPLRRLMQSQFFDFEFEFE